MLIRNPEPLRRVAITTKFKVFGFTWPLIDPTVQLLTHPKIDKLVDTVGHSEQGHHTQKHDEPNGILVELEP